MGDSIVYKIDTVFTQCPDSTLSVISKQLIDLQQKADNNDPLFIALITTSAVLLAALVPTILQHLRHRKQLEREQVKNQLDVALKLKGALIQLESTWISLANLTSRHNLLNLLTSLKIRKDKQELLDTITYDKAPELRRELTKISETLNIGILEYGVYFPHDKEMQKIFENKPDITFVISKLYTIEEECLKIGDEWNSGFINTALKEIKKDNHELFHNGAGDFYTKVAKRAGSQCYRMPKV